MPLAVWTDQLATGIETIDEQHRQLFEAANQLYLASMEGAPGARERESLEFLYRYTVDHFRAEEDHMRQRNYPGFAAHAVEHARLVDQVGALLDRLEAGRPVAGDVATFFTDWLKHHIHQLDMAYAIYLRARKET